MTRTPTPLSLGSPQIPQLGPNFGTINIHAFAFAFFLLIIFLVALYTAIAIYHWMRYGHHSILAIPAIALHIFVSLCFIAFAASGLV